MKAKSNISNEEMNGSLSKTVKEDTRRSSREAIGNKYAAKRDQSGQTSKTKPEGKSITSAKVSLLDEGRNTPSGNRAGLPPGFASTWQNMKTGFQSFKANIGARKFLPLRQVEENQISRASSSESLDQIFQRLKRPSLDQDIFHDEDNDELDNVSGPSR